LSSPTNGATFTTPFSGTLQATASDSDGSVAQVQFFVNNQLFGTDTSTPYSFDVANLGEGTHMLAAVATDNRGTTNVSAAVTISVVAAQAVTISGVQRPSVSQFSFTFTANAGSRYVIEGSPNLASWTALGTNTASGSTVSFTDTNAVSSMFFYRVRRDGNP
jgi:chitinase